MPVDPESINTIQLPLFDFQKPSTYAFELFPKVWGAAEALIDEQAENRRSGLEILEELNAARFSPLISYLLFSRLIEPDQTLRARIIKILANVLSPDENGQYAPDSVRRVLLHHLSFLQMHEIYVLLEAAEFDETTVTGIVSLFKTNCMTGDDLLEIVMNRKVPLTLRGQAANIIARVGYVDIAPDLERYINRLESKVNGQQLFSANTLDAIEEGQLLPVLKNALTVLQAL
jgi:hypothetical protein